MALCCCPRPSSSLLAPAAGPRSGSLPTWVAKAEEPAAPGPRGGLVPTKGKKTEERRAQTDREYERLLIEGPTHETTCALAVVGKQTGRLQASAWLLPLVPSLAKP